MKKYFLLLLLGVGCGYQLRQDKVSIDAGNGKIIKSPRIFVPVFDNSTAYLGAEVALTRAVKNQLQVQRGVEVVESRKHANLILLGNVVSFKRERDEASTIEGTQETEDAGGIAVEQLVAAGITISVGLDLTMIYPDKELGVDKLLWTKNYARSTTYRSSDRLEILEAASAAPFINRSRERLSLKLLSEQMAEEILDQVRQDF